MRDHDHPTPTGVTSGAGTAAVEPGPDLESRYRAAAALLPGELGALMRNRRVEPLWTGEGDRFTYERQTDEGTETVLVDPVAGTRTVLTSAPEVGQTPEAGHLPGPDGRSLFRRDHDLWLREADGEERALTDDGEPGFAWGALPENTMITVPFRRMGVVLPPMSTVHSPSGRRVLTMRPDERTAVPRVMVEQVNPGGAARPEVHEIRVRLDDEVAPPPAQCRLIDLDSGTSVQVDVADGLGETLALNGTAGVAWSTDERSLFLLHHPAGGSTCQVVEIDTATGARRTVARVEEPLYEVNQFLYNLPVAHVLPETREAVLFSQQDGWGHLYLHDLDTGEVRHRITQGDLVVRDLLHVDAERREVLFLSGTDEPGLHPLTRRVHRASLDGGDQQLLTPEPVDHDVAAPQPQFFHLVFGGGKPVSRSTSPSGRFLVDHMSTIDQPPVIVLRDAHAGGAVVMELERTDVSRLLEAGYRPPRHFTVRSEDGTTDLWGVVALPEHPLDSDRVPVVEHVYAGFQVPHVPVAWAGAGKTQSNHDNLPSLTALGFAAVLVDGRGTPGRDRDFRQWTAGRMHTTRGLEDHVTALRGLGEQLPQLDLDRVGVVGHSYGGMNAARLLMMFPEVYRAGVSSAGSHVAPKMPYGGWTWHMASTDYDRTSPEYHQLGNLHLADRLAGDLLLCCGEIDENATVDHTYALADALMKAGKRFDLKIWPGLNHYQLTPYVQMCFWDHFVRSLHGLTPPAGFTPA